VPLPTLLSSRSPAERFVVACVVPCAFGALTGWVLGLHEIGYLLLVGPIGIAGGYFAGLEHVGGRAGALRGAAGGFQFGALILIVHELSGLDPEADLPHPGILLVVLTTGFGILLGYFGGRTRERRERAASTR
jgi:hypothetical protein